MKLLEKYILIIIFKIFELYKEIFSSFLELRHSNSVCFQTLMFWYVCVCVCVCVRARVRIYGVKEGERDLKKKTW